MPKCRQRLERKCFASSAASSACPDGRGKIDDPNLSRLDGRAAVERQQRRTDRSARARAISDADHYDLEKVKKRIVEFSPFASSSLRQKSDLVLRRPAGRSKNVTGPEHRAAMNRKLSVRVRGVHDERTSASSPHLHRRAAGKHHSGYRKSRHQ